MRVRYTSAPLPFQGQKRMFVREFARVLEETFRGRTLFVDLFGGSGLLSRTIKDTLPDARVIYNDFDNYSDRLAQIPQTNAILADPPYLSTDKQSYNGYWGIAECLDVLKVLEGSFVYFTSSKSEIVPLAQWIERVTGWAPMRGAQMLERRNAVNHTSGYTDVMIYRAI